MQRSWHLMGLGMMSVMLCLLGIRPALAGTDLGGADVGFLEKAVSAMQVIVNFFEGPFGLFVAVVSLVLAIGFWMFSTRGDAELGWIGRVVIGVILIVNIPGFIVAIRAI